VAVDLRQQVAMHALVHGKAGRSDPRKVRFFVSEMLDGVVGERREGLSCPVGACLGKLR
jgi:hypothetical protein